MAKGLGHLGWQLSRCEEEWASVRGMRGGQWLRLKGRTARVLGMGVAAAWVKKRNGQGQGSWGLAVA